MNDHKWQGRIFLGLFCVSIAVGIVLIVLTSIGINRGSLPGPDKPSFFLPRQSNYPKDTIAVLNLFSAIQYSSDDGVFGLDRAGSIYWVDILRSVEDNPNVKAVLLRVNSPGGTVAATQELYNEILRLKKAGKTVVVSMGDIAASGAYYISCAADYIMANPGTLTGSIGVIMANLDFSGLMKKFGVHYNVIKSGKNKDLFSSYRQMSDEENSLLKSVIMDTYEQFFHAVQKGRKIKTEKLLPIADGRIFTGRQALKAHLIDGLGDFEDAIDKTADLSGIKGEPYVTEIHLENRGIFKYLNMSLSGLMKSLAVKSNPVSAELERAGNPSGQMSGNSSPVLFLYRP